MKRIVLISICAAFALTCAGAWWIWQDFVNRPAGTSNEATIYEVAPGLSFRAVAKDLEKKGLIRNAELFVILAKIRGGTSRMKVGEYEIAKNARPSEVLSILVSGKSIEHKITIAEGLSIFEIADLFQEGALCSREEFLKTVRDPEVVQALLGEKQASLEGYLFPETYSYTKFTDYHEILHEMVAKFLEVYKTIEPQSHLQGWDRHKIVTLASIIEKETGAPQERPVISSVFHNRLEKKMMLQTDPTIIYGKAVQSGHIEINITRADLSRPTAYNTYTFRGLPPGPIANPGREALLAAVQPAQSAYLYFVSHNDGTHQFSEDYKAHQKAVQKFQLDPKAREGKSWRDLKKDATH